MVFVYEKHTKHFLVANVTFHCVFLFIMLDTGWKNESTDTYTHNNEQNNKKKQFHPLECLNTENAFSQNFLHTKFFAAVSVCHTKSLCVCVCMYDFAFNAKPLSKHFFLYFSLTSYTIYIRQCRLHGTLDNQKFTLNSAYVCLWIKSSFKTWSENEKEKKKK